MTQKAEEDVTVDSRFLVRDDALGNVKVAADPCGAPGRTAGAKTSRFVCFGSGRSVIRVDQCLAQVERPRDIRSWIEGQLYRPHCEES